MSEQDNIAVVQKAYNNFKEGNIQGLLDLMPDNVTWQLPEIQGVPFAGKRSGRESVREFFVGVEANQETLEFAPFHSATIVGGSRAPAKSTAATLHTCSRLATARSPAFRNIQTPHQPLGPIKDPQQRDGISLDSGLAGVFGQLPTLTVRRGREGPFRAGRKRKDLFDPSCTVGPCECDQVRLRH